MIMGSLMWLVGLGSIGIPGFMGVLDGKLTGAIMLPLSGLLTVLFVGWKMKKSMVDEQMAGTSALLRVSLFTLVRYVAPVSVFIVLVLGIDHNYFNDFIGRLIGIAS
jgi:NSS family neurotransmitter:Na+ symporter